MFVGQTARVLHLCDRGNTTACTARTSSSSMLRMSLSSCGPRLPPGVAMCRPSTSEMAWCAPSRAEDLVPATCWHHMKPSGDARPIAGRCRRCCGSGGVIAALAVDAATSRWASTGDAGCCCSRSTSVRGGATDAALSSRCGAKWRLCCGDFASLLAQREPTRTASTICTEMDTACSP